MRHHAATSKLLPDIKLCLLRNKKTMARKSYNYLILSAITFFFFINHNRNYINDSEFINRRQHNRPELKNSSSNSLTAPEHSPRKLRDRFRTDLVDGFKFNPRILLVKIITNPIAPFQTTSQMLYNVDHVKHSESLPYNVQRFWMLHSILNNTIQGRVWNIVSKELEWTEMIPNPFQLAKLKVRIRKKNKNLYYLGNNLGTGIGRVHSRLKAL